MSEVKFITKDGKKIPLSITRLSDEQLSKIIREGNSTLVDAEVSKFDASKFKNKKMDMLGEKVAQAIVETRDRRFRGMQKEHEQEGRAFAEQNPEVRVLEKLNKDPEFKLNPEHTWGKKDEIIDLPTYIQAEEVPVKAKELFTIDVIKFKGKGAEGVSVASVEQLKEIQKDAFGDKLVSRRNNVDIFIKESRIMVSPNKNRPMVFQIKSRTYILAPRVEFE